MEQTRIVIGGDYQKKVCPLIDEAKSTIEMCMFDWRWYRDSFANPVSIFNHSLVRAVRRGVQVRVLTNYKEIIELVRSLGIDAKKWPEASLMHSKFLIMDSKIIVMGSHNITFSAFTSNMETSVIIESEAQAEQMREYFNIIWQR